MTKNIIPQNFTITKKERQKKNKHPSFLIWITGLSGSGKSTIANALEVKLHETGVNTYLLDGDNIRNKINKDLKFSPEDRKENIRRISEISNLFIDAGVVVLAAFVSPYRHDREYIKETVGQDNIINVYVSTSLKECEIRDVKGLYKKARAGEIKNFTGINAPYEVPINPDVEVNTEKISIEESVEKIMITVYKKLKNE
mgnify:CR=1 FL=1